MNKISKLKILNFAVLLQQQRYIVAISYLFYLQNGLTLADFLLFQSIFYFTGLLAEIPAGYLADIFPRKNVLIFSYCLFVVRILMWIICPNYWTILAGEILYGLSKSFYRGTSDSYIYDYIKSMNSKMFMINEYGKFNFFMSCGSAMSCLIGAVLYKYIGFSKLLGIELFCNSLAIMLLLFLPKIPHKKNIISLKTHLKNFFNIINVTIKNPNLNIYILYGSLLCGLTSIFVWNFQPVMKHFAIPVYAFGIIYFINHIIRALCSLNAHKFFKNLTLEQTGIVTLFLYIISFVLMYKVTDFNSKIICILVLLFICISIGIQLMFSIGNITRIHNLTNTQSRATISSVNFMLNGLFSGLFLMIFKYFVSNNIVQTELLSFSLLTIFLIILVNKMYSKSM